MRAATVVQQLCKSCRTCFMFYCMFYFTCDRSFNVVSCCLVRVLLRMGWRGNRSTEEAAGKRCSVSNGALSLNFQYISRILRDASGNKRSICKR